MLNLFHRVTDPDQEPPSQPPAIVEGVHLPPPAPAAGESTIERLLASMESHVADEAGHLEEYRRLAGLATDPVVAYLIRLVVEDEDRHHRLLQEMATSLRNDLTWGHQPSPIPSGAPADDPAAAELLAATRAFVEEEREEVRYLRGLARDEQRIHGGVFSLLLETMALDSEKHERIMRFILARLEANARNA